MAAKIISTLIDFETPHYVSVNDRYFRKGVGLSTKWKDKTKLFRAQVSELWDRPALEYENLIFEACVPFSFDWDNLGKFFCDGMEGIVYANDKQILRGTIERRPVLRTARVVVHVGRLIK